MDNRTMSQIWQEFVDSPWQFADGASEQFERMCDEWPYETFEDTVVFDEEFSTYALSAFLASH